MDTQVTSQLLMVRPANFSSNKETIETNKFQNDITPDSKNNIQCDSIFGHSLPDRYISGSK